LAVLIAIVAGVIAMVSVGFALRAMAKMQYNGAVQTDKLVGLKATVYVSIPPSRGGRGKITLNAQGRYMELDAVTDSSERLAVDELVEIVSTENECTVVERVKK
jgi:membrane-bound ClpP family serine protease